MKHRKRISFDTQRARRQEEKTSFSNLRDLMKGSRVFDVPDEEEEDLTQSIWKVLSDGRERTAEEVKVKLDPKTDLSDVSTVLKVLENEGKLIGRNLVNFALPISNIRTYVIKAGAILQVSQFKPQRKTLGVNTMASKKQVAILPTDSMDLAIWKATCDLRTRRLDEIVEIVGQFGFHRGMVKDRVVALAYRGWYSRSGQKVKTTYTLKKDIKAPDSPKEAQVPLEEQKVNSTTTQREVVVPPVVLNPVIPVVSAVAIKKEIIPMIVTKDDNSDVAIWKVMHDLKPMSPGEVGLLLEEYGFKPKTIATRLGYLFNHLGWFDRVEEGKTFLYTLRSNIPMPEMLAKAPQAKPAEEPATGTNPVQGNLEGLDDVKPEANNDQPQPEKEESTMSRSDIAEARPMLVLNRGETAPVQPVPVSTPSKLVESNLLRFSVNIKETTFTIDQLCILVDELMAAGYGEGRFLAVKPGLLVTKHQIRDEFFTDKELEELCVTLKANNFHLYKKM